MYVIIMIVGTASHNVSAVAVDQFISPELSNSEMYWYSRIYVIYLHAQCIWNK